MNRKLLIAYCAVLLAAGCAKTKAGVTRESRGNNGGNGGVSSPVTVTLSRVANHDVCFVVYGVNQQTIGFTPPSGWTQLGSNNTIGGSNPSDGYITFGLFYHVWSTGDTTTPSFADNGGSVQDREWFTVCYSGVNTTTPFDPNTTPSQNTAASNAVTLSAVSPTNTSAMLTFFGFTFTPPSGGGSTTATWSSPLTQYAGVQPVSSFITFFGADGTLTSPGSTGSKTMTATNAVNSAGWMIAIQPPGGGGGGS